MPATTILDDLFEATAPQTFCYAQDFPPNG
jgi:hypothetical protein